MNKIFLIIVIICLFLFVNACSADESSPEHVTEPTSEPVIGTTPEPTPATPEPAPEPEPAPDPEEDTLEDKTLLQHPIIGFLVFNPDDKIIIAEEDTVHETDYYIFRIKAGEIYSALFFVFVDEIIDFVHQETGWYLPDSEKKVDISFDETDPTRTYAAPWAYNDPSTGELKMSIQNRTQQDYITNDGDYRFMNFHDFIHEISHEYAHVLSLVFSGNAQGQHSVVHEEGHATYIHNAARKFFLDVRNDSHVFKEWFDDNYDFSEHFSDFAWEAKSVAIRDSNGDMVSHLGGDGVAPFDPVDVAIIQSFSDIINDKTKLSNALKAHNLNDLDHTETDAYSFGALFYQYIYENHGSQYAREILITMNSTRPSDAVSIINEILGVDILETYPVWFNAQLEVELERRG